MRGHFYRADQLNFAKVAARVLSVMARGPLLNTELEPTWSHGLAWAEERGYCFSVMIERHEDIYIKSVFRWNITDPGRAWLKANADLLGVPIKRPRRRVGTAKHWGRGRIV
jgi:hypothetical protein